MNKQQEPRLRFKGFTGAWEEKVLGEFVKSLDAGVSVNSEDILPDSDEFSVLKTSCLSSGIFDKNERKRVLSQTEIERLKEELKDNSILMSRMNTPNLVGLSAYIEKAPKNTFLPDRLWQLKINNEQASTEWLAYYLSKPENLFRIQDNATGTSNSMKNITKNDVFQFEFLAPSLPEQTHFGLFFRRLDSQIAESRAVLEKSRQLKKAMLAKMFPANGEKIPKIRFKGFEGEWEYRKLGEIGSTFGGLTNKSREDFGHGDARYITYMNVYQNALSSEHQLDSIEIDVKQNEVKKGDVLFTTSSETPEEVGMSSVWAFDINNVYLNSFCFGYRLNKQIDLNYLAYCLRSDYIRSQMILLAQGISRYNISKKGVMEIEILIPTSEEQTVIGNFFRQLDETIALQSAEVEKLNQLKKGLLAAMLV